MEPASHIALPSHITPSHIRIVEEARTWIGTPFLSGQAAKGEGCNCMGLVVGVLREAGLGDHSALLNACPRVFPPGYVRERLAPCCLEVSPEERIPGDILLFTVAKVEMHAGIYVGISHEAERMIHACMNLGRVVEQQLGGWEKRLTGVFRYSAW